MADRLVELVTGRQVAGPADRVGVEVQVVITDRALLGASGANGAQIDSGIDSRSETASVRGYGPVPARWVRDLLTPSTAHDTASPIASPTASAAGTAEAAEAARVWVRRLLIDPVDGSLVAMDSRRRLFDGELRRFLLARDETCRTPWCDAPARHADHVTPYAQGGPTTPDNGQGLCVRCNLAKEHPGWRHQVVHDPDDPDHTHTVEVTTPTGHRHRTHAPPVLPPTHATRYLDRIRAILPAA